MLVENTVTLSRKARRISESFSCIEKNKGTFPEIASRKRKKEKIFDDMETVIIMLPHTLLMKFDTRKCQKWILDSGCTRHMSNSRENFVTFIEARGSVQLGDNDTITSIRYGNVRMATVTMGVKHILLLRSVLYTPDLMYNLIYISQVSRNNFKVIIDNEKEDQKKVTLKLMHKPTGQIKMVGIETTEGLYEALVSVCSGVANIVTEKQKSIWHERLGHCSSDVLRDTIPHVRGIKEINSGPINSKCESCVLGKSIREPRRSREVLEEGATEPMERLCTDLVGPMQVKLLGKSKYFETLLDE